MDQEVITLVVQKRQPPHIADCAGGSFVEVVDVVVYGLVFTLAVPLKGIVSPLREPMALAACFGEGTRLCDVVLSLFCVCSPRQIRKDPTQSRFGYTGPCHTHTRQHIHATRRLKTVAVYG